MTNRQRIILTLVIILTVQACSGRRCDVSKTKEIAHRELCVATLPQSAKQCEKMPYDKLQELIKGVAVDMYLKSYIAASQQLCRENG